MIIEKLLNSKKIFVRQKQESIEKIINIILYDYENVNNLYGIETLDRSSTVYIFLRTHVQKYRLKIMIVLINLKQLLFEKM